MNLIVKKEKEKYKFHISDIVTVSKINYQNQFKNTTIH